MSEITSNFRSFVLFELTNIKIPHSHFRATCTAFVDNLKAIISANRSKEQITLILKFN